MTILQCGFLASGPSQAGIEPGCSKDIASPLPVPVSVDVQLVKAHPGGWGFALASTADSTLYAWGVNQATLLGKSGSADEGADPSTLDLVATGVEAAAGGFDHALVVRQGKLLTFGPNVAGPPGFAGLFLRELPLPAAVVAVAAGEHHSLALTAAGDVYAFGSNREGQLGADTGGRDAPSPLAVLGPARGTPPAAAVAAGARHSAAVDAAGRCLAWGWSLHGQCGTGAAVPSVAAPTPVAGLGPLRCVGVAAGMASTLVCTEEGSVYAWGGNADGELGLGGGPGAEAPQLVEGELEAEHVVAVAAGARHCAALCRSGRAFAWGYGAFGQLGGGGHGGAAAPQLVAVPPGSKAVGLAAGWWHTVLAVE